MPNEAFFYWNPELLSLGRQIGQINYGAFLAKLSAPILVQWVPCPSFSLFKDYFYKKLSLYIHILNIYLGLGFEFEFGLQRISFNLRVSVIRAGADLQIYLILFVDKTNFSCGLLYNWGLASKDGKIT